uniref:Uncharacterized protein n=1 Tax=Yamadaella caenomyce TaxID=259029 RepID=A0A1G4NZ17_9FLOR|nr:Hypothetical protein ORF_2 [Yamadaella caenomyce]SCW23766.1 Hypothetical protein ORF_2 [Yamadaella caenomyce]
MPFSLHLNSLNHNFVYQYTSTVNQSTCSLASENIIYLKQYQSVGRMKQSSKSGSILLATESIYRFGNSQFYKSNLFKELLSTYWSQTIFLSSSTPVTQKYAALIAKQEGMLMKNHKKKFLGAFTKALQNGSIRPSGDSTFSDQVAREVVPIKYIWHKGLYLDLPRYLNGLWANKRSPNFPTLIQNKLLDKLKQNNFPLFVVANNFNQMLMAEPPNQIPLKNNLFNKLYYWYYDRFLWMMDYSDVYEGWFFVNPKDAEEYKKCIASKYSRSVNQNGINVLPSSLYSYYRLNRTSAPRTEFRLFPDLVEVGKLVTSSQYRKGLLFDKRQSYGKNYFQGQPIYFIENTSQSNKDISSTVNYFYQVPGDEAQQKYAAVFFNKQVALDAWSDFRYKHPSMKLPVMPRLRVYNLEDFLKDNEKNEDIINKNFLFIPSKESYQNLQMSKEQRTSSTSAVSPYFDYCKVVINLWSQRLLWSLTNSQAPN